MLRFDQSPDRPRRETAVAAKAAPTVTFLGSIDVRQLIFGHKLLILSFVLASTVLAYVISQVIPPKYVSFAELYIDPQSLQILDKPLTPANDGGMTAIDQVESQSRVITSQSVLKRVVDKLHLDQDSYFNSGSGPADLNAIDALYNKVTVKRPERTFVVSIGVASNEAAKSAKIANALAQAYIDQHAESVSASANRTSQTLSGRLTFLKEQAATARQAVDDFKKSNDLIGTRKDLVSEDQLTGTNTELVAARTRTAAAQARYDQAQAARKSNDTANLSESLRSQTIVAMRTQQAEARRKLAELSADLGPAHPQVRQAEQTIREIGKSIDEEVSRIVASAKSDLDRAKQDEASVTKLLNQMKSQSVQTNVSLSKLQDLESEATAAQTLYQNVLVRARETSEFGKLDSSNTRVISDANPPSVRAFPPRVWQVLALGAALGLLMGILAALGLEYRALQGEATGQNRQNMQGVRASVGADIATEVERTPKPAKAASSASLWRSALTAGLAHKEAKAAPVDVLPKADFTAPESDLIGELSISARQSAVPLAVLPGEAASLDLDTIGLPTGAGVAGQKFQGQVSELCRRLNIQGLTADENILVLAGANQREERSIAALNLALRAAAVGLKVLLVDSDDALTAHVTEHYPDWRGQINRHGILPSWNHVDFMPLAEGEFGSADHGLADPFARMRQLRLIMQRAEHYDVVIFDGLPENGGRERKFLLDQAAKVVFVQQKGVNSVFVWRGFEQAMAAHAEKRAGTIVVELPKEAGRQRRV